MLQTNDLSKHAQVRSLPMIILFGLICTLSPADVARAVTFPTVSWPGAWANPTQSGSTFVVNTYWGALSLGCKNANKTNRATYYLDSGTKAHTGIDMARGDGQVVVAIADGTVVENGQPWGAANRNVVVIEHTTSTGEKFLAVYGHLYSDVVPKGSIARGARVGRVQTAGTGAHLHFGIKPGAWTGSTPAGSSSSAVDANGNCTLNTLGTADPLSYLPSRTPSGSTSSSSVRSVATADAHVQMFAIANGAVRQNWYSWYSPGDGAVVGWISF
jgi:murein DD-endopeptidase MepM/ murein hydrolase activator NlpD